MTNKGLNRPIDMAFFAKEIAMKAHKNQTDKQCKPYIEHLARVAENFTLGIEVGTPETHNLMAIAWLHDILEDTSVTAGKLYVLGFSSKIVVPVVALTKIRGENYLESYIPRVKKYSLAIQVKLADLRDNMDVTRWVGYCREMITSDLDRLNKYIRAMEM